MRVIVRRPHAYRFLREYLPELEQLSRGSASDDGQPAPQVIIQGGDASSLTGEITLPDGSTIDASQVVVIDASKIPIPGMVALDSDGKVLGNISFLTGASQEDMLEFLREHAE